MLSISWHQGRVRAKSGAGGAESESRAVPLDKGSWNISQNKDGLDLNCGECSVVKTPHFHCRKHRLDPRQGLRSHMMCGTAKKFKKKKK